MRYLFQLLAVALCCSTLHAETSAPKRVLGIPVSSGSAAQPNDPIRCMVTVGPLVPVTAVAFSPDGKTLAVGGYKEVLIWDLVNATLLKPIGKGHLNDVVRALAFRNDGTLLAVGDGLPGRSGAVRLFNMDTGEVTAEFDGPKDVVNTVAFSPDGKLIAAGGIDPTVRVWDVASRKQIATLESHRGPVTGISFSSDGAWLTTASADATALLWEIKTWKTAGRIQQTGPLSSGALSPSGEFIALAVNSPTERGVRVRPVDYPEPPEPAPSPATSGTTSATSGTSTVTTGTTKPITLSFPIPTATPLKSGTTPAAAAVITGTASKPTPTPSPTPKKKPTGQAGKLLDTGSGVPQMAIWNVQGNKIYAACTDKTVKVLNSNGGVLATLTGHDDWVYCCALSPDGTRLASGSADGTIKLWSTAENRLMATLVQISPLTNQWLILTAKGQFVTSSPAAVQWKFADTKPADTKPADTKPADTKPADTKPANPMQNPEEVRRALKAPEPPPTTPRPTEQKPTTPAPTPTAKP